MDTDLTPRPDCLLLKWATSCSAEITSWLAALRRTCKCFFCPRLKTECAGCSYLTVPPLTVLFMLSRRRSLASLRLQRSSSSMRVSRLSVSLQSSFTAPTFSMKIRSLKRHRATVMMLGGRHPVHCPPPSKPAAVAMWKVHIWRSSSPC